MVGGVGFHGEPDEAGRVEIGYGMAEEYRGQGLTTTAVTLVLAAPALAELSVALVSCSAGPANTARRRPKTSQQWTD